MRRIVSCFCFIGIFTLAQTVGAQDQEAIIETRTQQGLHFELPPDWPVEKRNGVLAPIPMEEYLSRKLKGIDGRIEAMEQLLNAMDLRLRVMEEKLRKNQDKGLRSGG